MKDPHSELIRLAAMLARGDLLPKIDTERWYASTPMAERRQITEAIESAHERHKVLALDVRQIADTLRPSVQPPAVKHDEDCGGLMGICDCGAATKEFLAELDRANVCEKCGSPMWPKELNIPCGLCTADNQSERPHYWGWGAMGEP